MAGTETRCPSYRVDCKLQYLDLNAILISCDSTPKFAMHAQIDLLQEM